MRWLTDRFNKAGPGIPKDAPQKTGLALFGQIMRREYWELFKLNIMIILFSLPVFTIPATYTAATRVTISMVRDENSYLLRDFIDTFRRTFWTATICGIGFAAVLGVSGYATFIYGQFAFGNLLYAVPFAFSGALFLITLLIATHFFVILAERDLPLPLILRLAFLATLAKPLPALAAIAFIVGLWLIHILLYPVSVFMPAIFIFSLGTLATTFAVLGTTDFVFNFSTIKDEAGRRTDNFANVPKVHKQIKEN